MTRATRARAAVLAFALLPLAQGISSFRAAATLRTVATYDTAYYYVTARNFALGRGLTDTVLWQFLGVPDTVARPAGGYWEVGWPLVLGSLMRAFGHSQRAAILLCAALSALLPALTAWVAWLATRRLAVAWLAGALVIGQVRLLATDVTPDATLLYQLACLGALAAFFAARDRALPPARLVAAGAALALPMYVRGEGFVVAMAALPLLLFRDGWPRSACARRVALVGLGMALLALPFTARNLAVFGQVLPAGRSLRFWMTAYDELYRFASDPAPATFWAQGAARLWAIRWAAITRHLDQLTLQVPWPLLPFAAAGLVAHARAQRARAAALPAFLALTLLVPCLLVPLVASVDRFVMNALPVVCVLAAAGAVALRDAVRRLAASVVVDAVVAVAVLGACTVIFRAPGSVARHVDALRAYRDTPAALADAALIGRLGLRSGDVVLTDDPWRVAAVLDVATVMCPSDGSAAVDALVEKYRPRFVLPFASPALRSLAARQRPPMHPVGKAKDGTTWYELTGPVRQADGRPR